MHAHAVWTEDATSLEAGRRLGDALAKGVPDLKVAVVYATVHHDLAALLEGVTSQVPAGVTVCGCSSQGVVSRNYFKEDGFLAGAMGLGGPTLSAMATMHTEIQLGTVEKARAMAQALAAAPGGPPKVVVLYYDPLSRVDVPALLEGFRQVLPNAVLVGGGAGQPWGPMVQTYQLLGTTVSSGACVALGLSGPFEAMTARSSGAESTGISMTITRTEGNHLLEIDGQPALDVWLEMVGRDRATNNVDDTAAWAVGVRTGADAPLEGEEPWTIMAAFGFDPARRSVILQGSVPQGAQVLFHHRTVGAVAEGTQAMATRMRERLTGRRPIAVLTFECGARVGPFLGETESRLENKRLQETMAPDAAWLGMLAWGEIAPSPTTPAFCNYTFPLLVLMEP